MPLTRCKRCNRMLTCAPKAWTSPISGNDRDYLLAARNLTQSFPYHISTKLENTKANSSKQLNSESLSNKMSSTDAAQVAKKDAQNAEELLRGMLGVV